ncbi:tyrosine-type recombinase/integrase [Syntrophotalea acetylenica]|uniref:Integrase n=1 Tax=Syntrophotalea acetylenica TaxID=29542 RepID=A0A1L3GDJ4_SYNAC|nr:integrase arm-type DNA-binding domain-containing protein [Syntrophotalea acetylenica]APG23909.1 integrase [Syntrophotalea acetylenica]APG44489.1 integrase [Syntrophotalea acetylenica]
MPLTDMKIRNAKPTAKPRKMFDGDGLYLLISPTQKPGRGKSWRFKYFFDGKEKLLSMGSYPEIGLAEARSRRDQARKLIANGIDPAKERQRQKRERAAQIANTVELVAKEWLHRQEGVLAPKTIYRIERRLANDVYPAIGSTPIADLVAKEILEKVLRPIEDRGTLETAHRVRGTLSQIMRYGVACGLCERDATVDLRGALKPIQRKHRAALDSEGIPDPAKVGALLRAIDGFDGNPTVKAALRLHPLVATRPGELRHAEWTEIDLDQALWSIPAGRMKMKNPHIVPLSPQALTILRELQQITGKGTYLFPSSRSAARPISDNTLNAALRRMGYDGTEFVSHGWRAIFRTLADEVLQERIDIIEAQLAHQVSDALGRAYNRTSFLKERRALMNRWGSYLDGLKNATKVISLVKRTGSN